MKPSERLTAARQFVTEALADEEDVGIGAIEVTEAEGALDIALTLTVDNGTLDINMTI